MRGSFLHSVALDFHLLSGLVALVAFWIQVFRRKGGRLHRLAGWTYFGAMTAVILSAIPLTVGFVLDGQSLAAFFLGFLGLITVGAGFDAILASRNRTSDAWTRGPWTVGITIAITGYSIALLWLFLQTWNALLAIMGGLGLWGGIDTVRKIRNPPPYSWLRTHIGGVMATGIAVHIAFLLFGLRRLHGGAASFQIAAFVLPLIGFSVLAWWFEQRVAPSPSQPSDGASG